MAELPTPIESYIAAYNAIDVDAMLVCLADDVHFQNVAEGAVNAETRDKKEFAALARAGAAAFSARRQTVTQSITVADRTMVKIDYAATVAADLPNGWKAGQELAFRGASYFELSDGLISRIIDES
ncbi:nuclear transport factor 2 family protein [Neoaquamicrobium sediminum]|uniref:nuclear transport factor 2 family protein n=1 Tax=Neoaquamicrobium sediminum TaxID=1849104 RepID=UPI004036E45E